MLARSFLSATDLGISEIERDALKTVLGMLERGELHHAPTRGHFPIPIRMIQNGFNMGVVLHQNECGTVACLCGWARVVAGDNDLFARHRGRPAAVSALFQMDGRGSDPKATPAQAAHALSNYLTTGSARWDLALAEAA